MPKITINYGDKAVVAYGVPQRLAVSVENIVKAFTSDARTAVVYDVDMGEDDEEHVSRSE